MDYIVKQARVISRTIFIWSFYLVQDVLSDACTYRRGAVTSYVYCEHGCCGSETDRKCCAYEISTSVLVVACVVSGLVVMALIAAIIICCYKNYKDKQQSRVRQLRQEQQRNAPVRPAEPPKPPSYVKAPPEYSEEMPDSHYRPRTASQNNPGNISYNTRFSGINSRTENVNTHPLGTAPIYMTRVSGNTAHNTAQLPPSTDDAPPRYSSLERGPIPITNTSNVINNANHRRFIRTPPDPNTRNNSTIMEEESNSTTDTESVITQCSTAVDSRTETRAGRSVSRVPPRVRNLQSRQATTVSTRSRMATRSSANTGNTRNTTLTEMDDSDVSSLANI